MRVETRVFGRTFRDAGCRAGENSPISFLGSVEAAELPSSPSRLIPAMADESWKASPTCWLCNRRAYKEADKHRLPVAAGEPHDLIVRNPDSEWVHEPCSRQVRKSVGRMRTSASAEPPKRRSSRNAGPEPLAPLPPPPPRASFRPSSSGASGQLEPLSQGAYWDAPSSRRGEAVSPAGPRTSPLGPGTRAVSASSGTAASSTTLEDTPQLFVQGHLLGGLRTGLAAAMVREQTGRAARPPPASPATRVAVGSMVPWSSLDAAEARVRGKAESQARKKSFKQVERLDYPPSTNLSLQV